MTKKESSSVSESNFNITSYLTTGISFVLIVFIFSFSTNSIFSSSRNLSNMLFQGTILAIVALGYSFILKLGHIDLSVGAVMGVTGFTMVSLMQNMGSGIVSNTLIYVIVIIMGLVIGAIQGSLIGFMKLPSPLVTLGTMILYGFLINKVSSGTIVITNESFLINFINGYTPGFVGITLHIVLMAAYFGLIMWSNRDKPVSETNKILFYIIAGIIAILYLWLSTYKGVPNSIFILYIVALFYTLFGIKSFVGKFSDHSIKQTKDPVQKSVITFITFTLMGGTLAIAGILFCFRIQAWTPYLGADYYMSAILACLIGGVFFISARRTTGWIAIAAIIVAALTNGLILIGMEMSLQYLVTGFLILLFVAIVFIIKGPTMINSNILTPLVVISVLSIKHIAFAIMLIVSNYSYNLAVSYINSPYTMIVIVAISWGICFWLQKKNKDKDFVSQP